MHLRARYFFSNQVINCFTPKCQISPRPARSNLPLYLGAPALDNPPKAIISCHVQILVSCALKHAGLWRQARVFLTPAKKRLRTKKRVYADSVHQSDVINYHILLPLNLKTWVNINLTIRYVKFLLISISILLDLFAVSWRCCALNLMLNSDSCT